MQAADRICFLAGHRFRVHMRIRRRVRDAFGGTTTGAVVLVVVLAHASSTIDRPMTSCYGGRTLRIRVRGGAISVALLAAHALACGPVEYLSQVSSRAATAVADAKTEGAETWSPFEYVAACEYLHEAREAGAHAHYQDAIEYGQQAELLAARARVLAQERRRSSLKPNEFDDPETGRRGRTQGAGAAPGSESAPTSSPAPSSSPTAGGTAP